jgi:signal transduction histidine kinase/DNA-binding response OmpR family regulator
MNWLRSSYILGFVSLLVLLLFFHHNKTEFDEAENFLHLCFISKDRINQLQDSYYEIDLKLLSYSRELNDSERFVIAKSLLDIEDQIRELNIIINEIAKYKNGRDLVGFKLQIDNRHFINYFISRVSGFYFTNGVPRIFDGKIKEDVQSIESIIQQKINILTKQREAKRDFVRSLYMFILAFSMISFAVYAWVMSREYKRREIILNQLELAVSSAKKNLELKNQFVATISHEIRTPLNGIIGVSKLLKENIDPNKKDFYLDLIVNSGNLLLKIVNDLLDFSKVEAKKIELELSEFDLVGIKEQVLGLFFQKIKNKKIKIYSEFDPEIKNLYLGDQARIIQILTNLVGNAIKFTNEGYVYIKISKQKSDIATGIDLLKFEVSDTGIGINEEDKDLLFQPFNQIKNEHSKEGTGLGLAISKKLVDLMNGKIGVFKNDLGQTTFWFSIPLKKMKEKSLPKIQSNYKNFVMFELSQVEQKFLNSLASFLKIKAIVYNSKDQYSEDSVFFFANEEEAKSFDKTIGSKVVLTQMNSFTSILNLLNNFEDKQSTNIESFKKSNDFKEDASRNRISILLVEDNITNQILAQELLEKNGYIVTVANDGQEAVEKVQSLHFDAILMDCQMPIKDGYEATNEIRNNQKTNSINENIPIIAMTANAMPEDINRCLKAGMDKYISKPFDIDELDYLIKEVIVEKNRLLNLSEENKKLSLSDVFITLNGIDQLVEGINSDLDSNQYGQNRENFLNSIKGIEVKYTQCICDLSIECPKSKVLKSNKILLNYLAKLKNELIDLSTRLF